MKVGYTSAVYSCMHCWEPTKYLPGPDVRAHLSDPSNVHARTREEVVRLGKAMEWLQLQAQCNADARLRRLAVTKKKDVNSKTGVRGLGSFCRMEVFDPVRHTLIDAMHMTANVMSLLLSHVAGHAKNVCSGAEALVQLETRLNYRLNPCSRVSGVHKCLKSSRQEEVCIQPTLIQFPPVPSIWMGHKNHVFRSSTS